MNYIGLISILLAIVGSVWFLSIGLERMGMIDSSDDTTADGVPSVLDSARKAADQLGDTAP